MDISIKEFNTYQNHCKKYNYQKISCTFCASDIIPIEKNEFVESVKCIYCNTIIKLNSQTKTNIKNAIKEIIEKQLN